jgi:hypothetical protein
LSPAPVLCLLKPIAHICTRHDFPWHVPSHVINLLFLPSKKEKNKINNNNNKKKTLSNLLFDSSLISSLFHSQIANYLLELVLRLKGV